MATFESAGFGFPGETIVVRGHNGETTVDVDEFVKERTRLYRETWLLPVLDRILDWADPTGTGDVK